MRYYELICEAAEASLRPAIRYNGEVYIGELGEDHLATLRHIPDRTVAQRASADSGTRGFATERGRYLNRRQAHRYAAEHHLFRQGAADWMYTAPELISEWLQTWLDRQMATA